ncbi:Uncharacterised protein [Bacillus paralicheniformis]|nr:Uncharacterised protein [Bacillus paralicheniformis]
MKRSRSFRPASMTLFPLRLLPLLLLRPIKLMKHLHQRALLNPGHIAPRNPELLRDFALRFFFLQIKAEAADDDFLFPSVQNVDVFFDFFKLHVELDGVDDVFVFRFEDIDEADFNATRRLSVFVALKQ